MSKILTSKFILECVLGHKVPPMKKVNELLSYFSSVIKSGSSISVYCDIESLPILITSQSNCDTLSCFYYTKYKKGE